MKSLSFLALLIAFGLLVLGILFSGLELLFLYIDVVTFVLTFFIPLLILMTHYSFSEIINAFKTAFTSRESDLKTIKKGILFFNTAIKLVITSGVITMIFGFITILSFMGTPQEIAKGTSAALLSILYSAIYIVFIILPFRSALKKKLIDNE